MNLFTGNARFPAQRISSRPDGLHAAAWLGNGQPKVTLFRNESDVRTVGLATYTPPTLCELTDRDSVIVAACDSTATPMIFTEYAVADLRVLSQFNVGDTTCRCGASCRTKSGIPFFVTYRDVRNQAFTRPDGSVVMCSDGLVHLDATMLKAGTWQTKHFTFPQENGLIDLNGKHVMSPAGWAMAEGADGLAYLFFTNDSSGSIHCVRFNTSGAVPVMVDHWGVPLIPEQSISGENPGVTATFDQANGRIILGYQSVESLYPPKCQGNGPYVTSAATVLMALYPDKRTQQIARLPWENHHDPSPCVVGWQRPDGIYYVTTAHDREQSCAVSLRRGKVVGSSSVDAGAFFRAYSADGWHIAQKPIPNDPRGNSNFELSQIKFEAAPAPINYAIEDSTAEVAAIITWADRKTADCVEVSTDNGATWKECLYYAPLRFSATGEVRMRVKRA